MRWFLFSVLFIALSLFSEEDTQNVYFGPHPVPWFTGPLLAPSAKVLKTGRLKVQVYWNTFVKVGKYDSDWRPHSIENFYSEQARVQLKFGLFSRVDFQLTPRCVYQFTEGKGSFQFGDLPLGLDIQILQPKTIFEGPNLKLSFSFNAPTGKYQRLNPDKKGTDLSGNGDWFPGVGLNLSHFWYLYGLHYLEFRATGAYYFGIPIHVQGLNAYGDKTGIVRPGNFFILDSALQYSLTQNWALACDFRYEHGNKDSGVSTRASHEEVSLAPAIEYNFNKELGVIAGVWFTIAGRNVSQFANGIISLVAYF